MSKSRAAALGIRGRQPKPHALYGERARFADRDGALWTVFCDSSGYMYAAVDGSRVLDTAYGYAFSVERALSKALARLEAL